MRWLHLTALGALLAACDSGSGNVGNAQNGSSASGSQNTGGTGGAATPSGGDANGSNTGGASTGGTGNSSAGAGGEESAGAGGDSAGGGSSGSGSGGNTAGGSGLGGNGPAPGSGLCGAAEGQLFDASHPWNQRVDSTPTDAESEAIIGYLAGNHTGGQRFRIDGPSEVPNDIYGIAVLSATSAAPDESFEPTDDFYSPDCDQTPIPLPMGGAIEGESAYACDGDGDCHLVVIDTDECRLFEMWRANKNGADFAGGCLAVWDLRQSYEETLRGDCCTSADAAGLPIAAHMFNADEIAAGEIRHAIRFILPNDLIRERIYVRPATHSTGATSAPADAPPYGARVRLRADFDMSGLNEAAQIVATALQRYGMILSDGGNLTFTATNDRFTTAKWADVGLGPNDLTSLEWTDFEVPELGERFTWDDSCNCDRTPLTE